MSRNVPSGFVSPPTFFIVVSSGTSRTSAYPIGSPVSTATILPWILPAAAAGAGAPNAIAPATSGARADERPGGPVVRGRGGACLRPREWAVWRLSAAGVRWGGGGGGAGGHPPLRGPGPRGIRA